MFPPKAQPNSSGKAPSAPTHRCAESIARSRDLKPTSSRSQPPPSSPACAPELDHLWLRGWNQSRSGELHSQRSTGTRNLPSAMSTSKPSCRNTSDGVKHHLGTLTISPAEKKSFRTRRHKRMSPLSREETIVQVGKDAYTALPPIHYEPPYPL